MALLAFEGATAGAASSIFIFRMAGLSLFRGDGANGAGKHHKGLAVQAVTRARPCRLVFDKPGLSQQFEVLRYRGLGEVERGAKIAATAAFAFAQLPNNFKPGRVCKRLELECQIVGRTTAADCWLFCRMGRCFAHPGLLSANTDEGNASMKKETGPKPRSKQRTANRVS
ncbi:MAG TPA: hypothetical protein VLQ68_09255 [Rhizobiaceae bacterium]|nr:hypothetical protein [Rhizobiaceae bacterium]